MHYVYIIKSINFPDILYVGSTLNVAARITDHNGGESIYTSAYRPWELVWHCEFKKKPQALAFERYLKSHSGRAFMKKRLI